MPVITGEGNDPNKEVQPVASNVFSEVRTRTAIESELRYGQMPALDCVPKKLEMDYSVILNKPFFVQNITWAASATAGAVLSTISFPSAVLSNPLVRIPFSASVYYRAKASVVLQVAGTPMHSGLLLASVMPLGGQNSFLQSGTTRSFNKYLAAPHAFLSANESTPVIIEIPFYINSKLAPIAINGTTVVPGASGGDYATVTLAVINPMGVPTSGTTSLTISAHFIFNELEFYAPHVDPTWVPQSDWGAEAGFIESAKGFVTNTFDRVTSGVKTTVSDAYDLIAGTKTIVFDFIDSGRAYLRSLTGLHNPADATVTSKMAVQLRQNTNVVDAPIQIEKLDPYSQFSHYTRDYTFDTNIDEMLVSEIISKPQYIGTFTLKNTDVEGTLLFSRPITPFQEANQYAYVNATPTDSILTTSLFQNLHFLSRFWRGGIKLHIQSVMSNFHYAKLTIARNYSPDTNMITSAPSFTSVPNLMMETLEFTGHQVQTIKLPYVSLLEQLPCSTDPLFNALQHGMYYIYVHQPLVTNGSVTTNVKFNVYISADDDFQFFGYATRPLYQTFNVVTAPLLSDQRAVYPDGWEPIPPIEGPELEADPEEPIVGDFPLPDEEDEETLTLIDLKFECEADVEDQQDILLHEHEQSMVRPTDLRPIVSVRDYLRRFTRAFYARLPSSTLDPVRGTIAIDVATLLGVRGPQSVTALPPGSVFPLWSSPQRIINSMFLGYSGGARFKIGVLGALLGEVYYMPPGFHNYAVDAQGNRVWRGTSPIPQATSAPVGSNFREAILGTYQYAEKLFNTVTVPSALSPLPMQERPNYLMSQPDASIGLDNGAQDNRMSQSTCVFEVEVPHMTPFKFVGDASKGYNPQNGADIFRTASTDMGHLIVKLAQPLEYFPSVATINNNVAIEIFVSTDDVGRAGFQVLAPVTLIPSSRMINGANYNDYQIGPDCIQATTTAGFYPGLVSTFTSAPTSIVPAFDYTKSLYKTVV